MTAGPPTGVDRRRALLTTGLAVLVAGVVFGIILPQVIDYRDVWAALKTLTLGEILVLLGAGLLYYGFEGWLYAIVMPGTRLRQGVTSWVASAGVGSTVPALDMVTRYGMYRSWGFAPAACMRGILLSAVFDTLVKFFLPVLAVVLLAVTGVQDLGALAGVAVVAGAVLLAVIVAVVGAVRSQRFARGLATRVERAAAWGLTKVGRTPPSDLAHRVLEFRDDSVEVASTGWRRAMLASVLGKAAQFQILVIAMRVVGIPSEVLSVSEIFVVWTLVMLVTMIPITPGGIGVAELSYVWLFTSITGDPWASLVAAGVTTYRLVEWALPIPVGWALTIRWRRRVQRGELADPSSPAA